MLCVVRTSVWRSIHSLGLPLIWFPLLFPSERFLGRTHPLDPVGHWGVGTVNKIVLSVSPFWQRWERMMQQIELN